MEIRKIAATAAMGGLLGAGALGLAGAASATPYQPKAPKVTYSYTSNTTKVTKVVVTSGSQLGNGNTQQSASGAAGAISNPQLALGVNVGAQIPVQVGVNGATGFADAGQVQKPSLSQYAGENYSNNSTSVNVSAENGNFSSVKIGS